jgi:hypothetical protein
MKELCIDISTWQGGIDYNDIKNNCKYAILRAGFGDCDKDNRFEEHYNNLQGMHLGAYWYSYATSPEQARQEARLCLDIIQGKQFDLPIYFDIEDPSMRDLPRETLNNIVRAFGYEIQSAGYYFGVYSNLNWYCNIISGNELNREFDWWIALWDNDAPDPSYNINYGVWQFGSTWIGGQNVDGNYIYKDYPTIIREAGLNHLEPQPQPTPPQPEPQPTPEPTPTPEPPQVDLLDLVRRTIRGDFGNGQERVDALGDLYDEVQRQVNLNLENGNTQWDSI